MGKSFRCRCQGSVRNYLKNRVQLVILISGSKFLGWNSLRWNFKEGINIWKSRILRTWHLDVEKAEQKVVDTTTFELMLCVAVASVNVNLIEQAIQLMSDLEATINGEDAARHDEVWRPIQGSSVQDDDRQKGKKSKQGWRWMNAWMKKEGPWTVDGRRRARTTEIASDSNTKTFIVVLVCRILCVRWLWWCWPLGWF